MAKANANANAHKNANVISNENAYAKANTKSIANANTNAYTNAKCKSNAKPRPQTRNLGQHEAYDLHLEFDFSANQIRQIKYESSAIRKPIVCIYDSI